MDSTTMTCVLVCPEGYQANSNTGACEANCTSSWYDYMPSHICVESCPKPYYGYDNDTENVCVPECPVDYFAYDDICKDSCAGTSMYADPVTHRCVDECINGTYACDGSSSCVDDCVPYGQVADNSTNTCQDFCPTDPDYYAEGGICVMHCTSGTYADPTAGKRACDSLCE